MINGLSRTRIEKIIERMGRADAQAVPAAPMLPVPIHANGGAGKRNGRPASDYVCCMMPLRKSVHKTKRRAFVFRPYTIS